MLLLPGDRRPPYHAVELNENTPLRRGLIGAWSSLGGQDRPQYLLHDDTRSGGIVTTVNGNASTGYVSDQGYALGNLPRVGGNDGGMRTSGWGLDGRTTYSVHAVIVPRTLTSDLRVTTLGQMQAGASGYDWLFPYFAGSGPFTFFFFPANGVNLGSNRTYSQGDFMHVTGTYVSGKANGTRLYADGILDNQGTVTGTPGTTYAFGFGLDWTLNDNPCTFDFIHCFIWNRELSADEALALYDSSSRWDLYRPRINRTYFIPAAAGGATVSWSAFQSNRLGAARRIM